ncbi:rhodanese-like domain-containing protein [Marinicella gelatinilytica]|uniref:rhodanese-like domain-containing protein n=1 Tax=Marinicella gelatinilytica TaxID=2996017 RepID=UPI002260DFAD|nr:rhodanese-like domain-containing protein [Marinicella gelatinilytica]MCX7546112.1 rhodanese-like domain-containing protein [Marinicella gelatinilytica]
MSQLAEFTGNHPFLVMAFLIVAFLFFWTVLKEQSSQLKNINSDQLTRLVNQQNALLVDTRSAEDFAAGHIVNAHNIPMAEIDQAAKKLSKGKKRPVVVYCRSGRSSMKACQQLEKQGFEQIFNLKGGINAWVNDKLPLNKA